MKVLALVAEAWRADSAGGNVIDNLFSGMDAEFAQVYCSAALPQNTTCKKYFQFPVRKVVKSFLSRKPVGQELTDDCLQQSPKTTEAKKEKNFLTFFQQNRWAVFTTAKYMIWSGSNWKTPALKNFIVDFQPDVIFAPCYASPFMCALTRYAKNLTGKAVVTYSGDDNYSLRQFSLSPFFWINRFIVRHALRKTYPFYDAFYSMSEDESKELEPVVRKKIKILRKGVDISALLTREKHIRHDPIRLIYAGGVYIQRWKTLQKVREALAQINADGVKMQLDIYTQNTLTKRQLRALHDGKNSFVHSAISKEELSEQYKQSDIALHCESFSLKNRLLTRVSFSTKIIDCLSSGCAVMAIAWQEQTGLKYLHSQNAAFCVTDVRDIYPELCKIMNDPALITEYAEKARACAVTNHDIRQVRDDLYETFRLLSEEKSV